MMKNLPFPIYLLLCFFMLILSIPSQAIIATSTGIVKEQKTTLKQHGKLERLKKKLSKRMAKVKEKRNRTEREEIKKNLNRGLGMRFLALLLGFAQYYLILIESPIFWVCTAVSLTLIILGFLFSRKALRKIKNSNNPEQYKKNKRKAEDGMFFSVLALIASLLLAAAWIYFVHFFFI